MIFQRGGGGGGGVRTPCPPLDPSMPKVQPFRTPGPNSYQALEDVCSECGATLSAIKGP